MLHLLIIGLHDVGLLDTDATVRHESLQCIQQWRLLRYVHLQIDSRSYQRTAY